MANIYSTFNVKVTGKTKWNVTGVFSRESVFKLQINQLADSDEKVVCYRSQTVDHRPVVGSTDFIKVYVAKKSDQKQVTFCELLNNDLDPARLQEIAQVIYDALVKSAAIAAA